MPAQIDYTALAKNAGAISSTPSSGTIDYAALAKQAGAISSAPAELSPTLLESRQAASKSEFDANNPDSTVASRLRENRIDLLQPFDLRNIPGMLSSIGGALYQTATGKGTAKAQELVKGVVRAPIEPVNKFISGIAEGDYDKAAGGAGGILSQTIPAVEGLSRGSSTPASVSELPARVVNKGTELITELPAQVTKLVTGVHPDPVIAMTQALKPYAKNSQWDAAIKSGLPEIKASEAELGRPIANVDDMLEATKIAKKRLRTQYDAILGPKADSTVDGSPIAAAIEKSISPKVRFENPEHTASLTALADKYRTAFTIQELDDFMHSYNAELESYYSKYPAAKRTATAGNPDTAALEAGGRATRELLYKALDDPSHGVSARDINQRYGKLINIEKELYRRKNVNARQAPESLTEQIGKVGAAFKAGKGAVRVLTGDLGGASDIASAVAGRKMAQILKERNSTDYLIQKTFENFKQVPIPVRGQPVP